MMARVHPSPSNKATENKRGAGPKENKTASTDGTSEKEGEEE